MKFFEDEYRKRQSYYCTIKAICNMWNGTMFVDLDWPLNASSLLSASAELLVPLCLRRFRLLSALLTNRRLRHKFCCCCLPFTELSRDLVFVDAHPTRRANRYNQEELHATSPPTCYTPTDWRWTGVHSHTRTITSLLFSSHTTYEFSVISSSGRTVVFICTVCTQCSYPRYVG